MNSSGVSRSVTHRTTKIHVGNLTRNILRSHLQEIFSNYGKIRRLDIPVDSISGFNQGYSYIDYDCHQSAADALNFMNEGFLDGQLISVQLTYPLQRNDNAVRTSRRKSPNYSPIRRNWSPHLKRKPSSEYRRTRSPLLRRAPARFQRSACSIIFFLRHHASLARSLHDVALSPHRGDSNISMSVPSMPFILSDSFCRIF